MKWKIGQQQNNGLVQADETISRKVIFYEETTTIANSLPIAANAASCSSSERAGTGKPRTLWYALTQEITNQRSVGFFRADFAIQSVPFTQWGGTDRLI